MLSNATTLALGGLGRRPTNLLEWSERTPRLPGRCLQVATQSPRRFLIVALLQSRHHLARLAIRAVKSERQ
jgi:hypothetical protein